MFRELVDVEDFVINLDKIDLQSATWEKLVTQIHKRIDDLHLMMEADAPKESIDVLRGRVKELRGILIAGDAAPAQEPYDPMHY